MVKTPALKPFLALTFSALAFLAGCGSGAGIVTPTGTPSATLAATALTFNNAPVGTPTAAQTLTLSNNGTVALNISSILLSGTDAAFFTLSNGCGATLSAGASCTLSVTFKATDLANRTATITVNTNATPASQTITLVGSVTNVNQCKATVARKPQPTATASFSGVAITGKVMAGALPVIGATVQIYSAGNSGNGSAATSLVSTAITTDAAGAFNIPASFTCPYNLSMLYLVARGGKAGATGATNAGIVLMAPLGACNSIASGTSVTIDEATTVASAYALAQFMAAGGSIGASATNFSGLKLAAASAANLVNLSTGKAPGAAFPATGTPPTANINSLANALNACIVSTGASSTACTQLYAATAFASTTPSNTLDAALSIAKHPAASVSTLYTLSGASAAYSPARSAAPSDWTLFVTYAGGGMNAPSGLGIDGSGIVSVASYFYSASLFTNTGTPILAGGVTGNNLNNSYGLAVDQNDNIWIPNEQSAFSINGGVGSVTVLNNAGGSVATYSQGGLNYPVSIAIDQAAISWVVDYGNSHLTLLTNAGAPISGAAGYTTNQFSFPVAVAVDSKCYGYVANQSSNTITRVAQDGSSYDSFVTGSGASGLAVDASDNVWVANYYGNSVGQLSASGVIVSNGYSGGGINHPQGIAIDGSGSVWVANYRGPSITQLAGSSATIPGAVLSPAAGYGSDAALLEAFAIAIDQSGNLWVTNFGSNTLTEFVGLAAPVRTPMIGPVALP